MVRQFPIHHLVTSHLSSTALAIGLFVSLVALVGLCAKRSSSRKSRHQNELYEPPKSPLGTPKRILTSISNKMKKGKMNGSEERDERIGEDDDEGLWQRNILMGEKCQPLEFSGVIYYDNYGKRVTEIPRSPRAASNALQPSFTFPVPTRHSG